MNVDSLFRWEHIYLFAFSFIFVFLYQTLSYRGNSGREFSRLPYLVLLAGFAVSKLQRLDKIIYSYPIETYPDFLILPVLPFFVLGLLTHWKDGDSAPPRRLVYTLVFLLITTSVLRFNMAHKAPALMISICLGVVSGYIVGWLVEENRSIFMKS